MHRKAYFKVNWNGNLEWINFNAPLDVLIYSSFCSICDETMKIFQTNDKKEKFSDVWLKDAVFLMDDETFKWCQRLSF